MSFGKTFIAHKCAAPAKNYWKATSLSRCVLQFRTLVQYRKCLFSIDFISQYNQLLYDSLIAKIN